MAEFEIHDFTDGRRVYTLPVRTNWAEVSKVMTRCQNDLGGVLWDDAVRVTANEHVIMFILNLNGETNGADE